MRKSKKKLNYTVAVTEMTPFPGVILYVTGDYYKAADAIDNTVGPRNGSDVKASRLVIKCLDADTILGDKNTKGVTISDDELDNFIIVYLKDPEPEASTVVHEFLHAVMIVADRAGVDDKITKRRRILCRESLMIYSVRKLKLQEGQDER